jgi:hypothetical protein
MNDKAPDATRRTDVFLGEQSISMVDSSGAECPNVGRFFYNHQHSPSVWLDIAHAPRSLQMGSEVRIKAATLRDFKATVGGTFGIQRGGSLQFFERIKPLQEPIESVPAEGLSRIKFALLDCPWSELRGMSPQRVRRYPVNFGCGPFMVSLTAPADTHAEVNRPWGTLLTASAIQVRSFPQMAMSFPRKLGEKSSTPFRIRSHLLSVGGSHGVWLLARISLVRTRGLSGVSAAAANRRLRSAGSMPTTPNG